MHSNHSQRGCHGGKEVWNFIAGGRIGSPPVVHQGLAIFGCHDGCMHFYCLDAATGKMRWHTRWLSGLSSDKFTPREMQKVVDEKSGKAVSFDPERNKRIINDIIEVRDGKVWLFEMPVVDLADPKDTIINAETLVPPQLRASATGPKR